MSEAWKDRFFTPEEIGEIEAVFNDRFFAYLKKDENIFIEGHYSEAACFMTLTLKNQDETYYYPFEASIASKDNSDMQADEAKMTLIDFIAAYFDEFFAEERKTYVPIDWATFNIEGVKIKARGQISNKKLEKEADEILKSAGYNTDTEEDE